ncbi:MAG: proline--tRNA ligase, partial [Methanophagales archaeon ANME-1-THS]
LVLPPTVAPIQVVIVPIVFSGKDGETKSGKLVEQACFKVQEELTRAGMRTVVDNSEERPGAKFYRWEMKGVPLRIEIGPRDLRNEQCELVRRNDFTRVQIPLNEVVHCVKQTLQEIHEALHEKAKETLRTSIYETRHISTAASEEELEELRRRAGHGILSLFLCGRESCGNEVEARLGVSVLGEAVHGFIQLTHAEGTCLICSDGGKRVYVARAY